MKIVKKTSTQIRYQDINRGQIFRTLIGLLPLSLISVFLSFISLRLLARDDPSYIFALGLSMPLIGCILMLIIFTRGYFSSKYSGFEINRQNKKIIFFNKILERELFLGEFKLLKVNKIFGGDGFPVFYLVLVGEENESTLGVIETSEKKLMLKAKPLLDWLGLPLKERDNSLEVVSLTDIAWYTQKA